MSYPNPNGGYGDYSRYGSSSHHPRNVDLYYETDPNQYSSLPRYNGIPTTAGYDTRSYAEYQAFQATAFAESFNSGRRLSRQHGGARYQGEPYDAPPQYYYPPRRGSVASDYSSTSGSTFSKPSRTNTQIFLDFEVEDVTDEPNKTKRDMEYKSTTKAVTPEDGASASSTSKRGKSERKSTCPPVQDHDMYHTIPIDIPRMYGGKPTGFSRKITVDCTVKQEHDGMTSADDYWKAVGAGVEETVQDSLGDRATNEQRATSTYCAESQVKTFYDRRVLPRHIRVTYPKEITHTTTFHEVFVLDRDLADDLRQDSRDHFIETMEGLIEKNIQSKLEDKSLDASVVQALKADASQQLNKCYRKFIKLSREGDSA